MEDLVKKKKKKKICLACCGTLEIWFYENNIDHCQLEM